MSAKDKFLTEEEGREMAVDLRRGAMSGEEMFFALSRDQALQLAEVFESIGAHNSKMKRAHRVSIAIASTLGALVVGYGSLIVYTIATM